MIGACACPQKDWVGIISVLRALLRKEIGDALLLCRKVKVGVLKRRKE